MNNNSSRDGFSSRFGAIAAAAGSAVGLGNIWRFPYVMGENGGAAFLLVYIVFVFGIGIPVLMSELLIGRKAQKNAVHSFQALAPGKKWHLIGFVGVFCSFMILAYYSVVAGWTLHYVFLSVVNGLKSLSPEELNTTYVSMVDNPYISIFWMVVFIALTALVVWGGVEKGIEKYSKILMPVLFGIILLMCVRVLTLPGSMKGLTFLFNPDFSKLSARVVIEALGQACFSLSIGMGIMVTYGSYLSKKQNIGTTSFSVAGIDLLIAVLASIAIFPAVFAFNIDPGQGPGLVFVTLPNIFNQMFGGYFIAIFFFILLFIAALTSSISLLEVVVAYVTEEWKIKRVKATWGISLAAIFFGSICAYSEVVFNFFDKTSANLLLPLGAFFIVLFVIIVLKRKGAKEALEEGGHKMALFDLYYFIVKYVAPVAIMLIFLQQFGLLDSIL
jgi:NSS family neurotransmitter:Na+ symporter